MFQRYRWTECAGNRRRCARTRPTGLTIPPFRVSLQTPNRVAQVPHDIVAEQSPGDPLPANELVMVPGLSFCLCANIRTYVRIVKLTRLKGSADQRTSCQQPEGQRPSGTTTTGRVLLISCPRVGSKSTHQTSPRRGLLIAQLRVQPFGVERRVVFVSNGVSVCAKNSATIFQRQLE